MSKGIAEAVVNAVFTAALGGLTSRLNAGLTTLFNNNSRGPLEDLAEVRRIIESSDRSDEDKQRLIEYIINQCPDEEVKKWLKPYFQELVVYPLVDMYYFLIKELEKKKEKEEQEEKEEKAEIKTKEKKEEKEEKDRNDIHITFVAPGEITSSMFPASCLMPQPSIRDVILYSPWNCAIDADVAYGVATGSIELHHRRFFCVPQQGCPHPDGCHQPTNLPNHWNSMSEAGELRIPDILLSPVKEPKEQQESGESEDGAWKSVVFLREEFGEPMGNRVLIPLTRQEWLTSSDQTPFSFVTLVLSVVLKAFGYRATVHLAACLSRSKDLNEAELKEQYEYTIDNTRMGLSEEWNPKKHDTLYKYFKDIFG